jgi:uncharacterized protein YbjQ (UPF0145 family)
LAKERISNQLNRKSSFFSSDLSCREFIVTQEAGIEPISQVMGTSFMNVSYFGSYVGPWRFTGELSSITESQLEARSKAVARMRREAELLGASGVIGVKLTKRASSFDARTTEFTAIGTAVRLPNMPTHREPFTSDLNGQEFWQLYRAGYVPKSLVMGLCSYYVQTNWSTAMQTQGLFGFGNFQNQEIDQYTRCFSEAREAAMERLTQQMYESGADGTVGVKVTHDIEHIEYESNNSRRRDLLINFEAIGTAVDFQPELTKPSAQSPLLIYNLSKARKSSIQVDIK